MNLPLTLLVRTLCWNGLQTETLTTSSIAATCLGELPELAAQGVDEEVIRGVNGAIYLGEPYQTYGHGGISLKKLVVCLAGEETVSGTPGITSSLLIIWP